MSSTPKPNHIPSRITREDFQAGRMKPGSYSYEDISAALVDHLSRSEDELTSTQLEGLNTFKYNGSWNLGNPENIEDLRKFFGIFNDIFFNGVLTGYERDLRWYVRNHCGGELGYCQFGIQGWELDPRFRLEYPLVPIWVRRWVKKLSGTWHPIARIRTYLDVLIHEMLHALFMIYVCSCKNGCAEKLHDAFYRWRGHCPSWQAAALAIEKATILDGIPDLDLHRTGSLVGDIRKGGGASIPAQSELDRLGLDLEEIEASLASCKDEQALEDRKETRKQQLRMANRCMRDWWIADKDVEVMEECRSLDEDEGDNDDTA